MFCLYLCHETKPIQVVSYFLCFLLSHWCKFLIKDGRSRSARLNLNSCPVQLMNRCLMRNNLFPFLPSPHPSAESWDRGHPQAGSKEVDQTCACRQSKLSAHRKCNFQNFIKDLMFFFSCLGCSQVISMTTGQQPSFLKTDNPSSDCSSAHQPLIKMSEHIG